MLLCNYGRLLRFRRLRRRRHRRAAVASQEEHAVVVADTCRAWARTT